MTLSDLSRRLDTEPVVVLSADAWAAFAPGIEPVERHDTGLAGELLIVRLGDGLAAVESPSPDTRAVRRFVDADAARRFVEGRLDTYDRMWDGCGCKVDYDA